eukprot:12635067-Alexandrium_andersonii.AAC.1
MGHDEKQRKNSLVFCVRWQKGSCGRVGEAKGKVAGVARDSEGERTNNTWRTRGTRKHERANKNEA